MRKNKVPDLIFYQEGQIVSLVDIALADRTGRPSSNGTLPVCQSWSTAIENGAKLAEICYNGVADERRPLLA